MDAARELNCSLIPKSSDSLEIIGIHGHPLKDNKKNIAIKLKNLISILSNGCTLYSTVDIMNISIINFSSCDVSTVPDVIGKLNLKEFYLANNKIIKVPTCLYTGLDQLEVLDLSFNQIEDFDVEPRCHSVLRQLHLHNNTFTNIPHWILAFRGHSLEKLDYSVNKLTELKCLFNKYDFKLTTLKMRNCTLRDVDLPFLKNITTLRDLDISNRSDGEKTSLRNHFDDLDELFVKVDWKDMTIMNMNNLGLSVIPAGVVWLDSIRELYLTNNNISWLPNDMEFLVNLEVLDVSNNDLTYLSTNFYFLRNVKVIKAAHNNINEIKDITPMSDLKTLDLYGNHLEEFNYYIKTIVFIDLEKNFFETEDCEFYKDYSEKRNKYRKTLQEGDVRGDGINVSYKHLCLESASGASESSKSTVLDELSDDDLEPQCCDFIVDNENWDEADNSGHCKHPDVTSSDEEWQGEIMLSKFSKDSSRGRTKIYNDEWMFCDA